MRKPTIALITGLLVAAGAAPATAQALTDAFTYQGVLNQEGQPANGAYDFEFRVFDAAIGGSPIGPGVQLPNQAVTDGLLTQQLDFGNGVFDGSRRFLEVRVRPVGGGAFTTLPRQEVRATPNAIFAKSSEIADTAGFAMTSGTTLQQAFDNGPSIDLNDGVLSLDDLVNTGQVDIAIGDGFDNDAFQLLDRTGLRYLYASNDSDGDAGFLSIPGPGFTGFTVNGNAAGSPTVVIEGTASDVRFFTDLTGTDSVILPANSIAAAEIADEPGVASSTVFPTTTVSAPVTVTSRTITAPSPGFIVAIGTAQFFIDHVAGTDTAINVALSRNPAQISTSERVRNEIEASVGSDASLSRSVTVHNVFPVSEGPTTIYLNASASGAGVGTDASLTKLTLLYVPTEYGTVSRVPESDAPAGDLEPSLMQGSMPALTPADLAAERDASIAANLARIESEIEAMRTQIEALRGEREAGNGVSRPEK